MLNESETEETEKPVPPSMSPKAVLAIKIAIAVMTLLIVVGLILLVAGMIYKTPAPSRPQEAARHVPIGSPLPLLNAPLKPGMQVGSVLADQGRLIVHLHGSGNDEILIFDLASGWQQQRIIFAPQQ
jgi:hypothetical protein